jgi:mercuric reductase
MKKYKINVQGMTCSGCEEHVATALENIGAVNIEASFLRNEATFELPDGVV